MTTAKPTIAFLGPISSYSHQAALDYFPTSEYEHIPVVTIRDIFETVQAGRATRGVVPFENSTNGSVVFTLDLLADREDLYPNVTVCGETYLDVRHNLLGHFPPSTSSSDSTSSSSSSDTDAAPITPSESGANTPTAHIPNPIKPRAKPRTSLKHVQRIYSHPQAFGQCEAFLGAYLKGIERIDVSSTSRAAELVKADSTGTSAAIASRIAAEVHQLDFLAEGIEDRADNTTRFFVIRKEGGVGEGEKVDLYSGLQREKERIDENDASKPKKSIISFTTDHTAPGSLASVLESFRHNGLNLTSINSRPSRVVPFQYIFFVEFQGSRTTDPEGKVKRALEGVEAAARTWRWLGSFTDRLRR